VGQLEILISMFYNHTTSRYQSKVSVKTWPPVTSGPLYHGKTRNDNRRLAYPCA
jgi:hypothetical protein